MAKVEPQRAARVGSGLVLGRNRSRADAVEAHLIACDAAFLPPLSSRVSIADYAARIAARAERFEAWAGPDLVGLAALYCNAEDRRAAFLTNLSVAPAWMRGGIARRLLGEAIHCARAAGFAGITLSVDPDAPALGLYRSLGFVGAARGGARTGDGLSLVLDLLDSSGP